MDQALLAFYKQVPLNRENKEREPLNILHFPLLIEREIGNPGQAETGQFHTLENPPTGRFVNQ